ncbi:ADP-ribosylglycohydrolase family protein [Desulfonatronospira sp. MSAO_Bac3]
MQSCGPLILGDDADTTAAVCGQLAGAYYGFDGIPPHWTEKLAMKEKILELSDRLYSEKTSNSKNDSKKLWMAEDFDVYFKRIKT